MSDATTWAGKRVFVTGGTGFIGRPLLDRLTAAGARVHAVTRGQDSGANSDVTWYQGNLADASLARTILHAAKPDVIYHLAGHVARARGPENIVPTFQGNLMTTVNLLTVAQSLGCERFILPGSLEEPVSEDSEVLPSSPYAMTKWASSAYARMFHALYAVPTVILRVFMVYGPGYQDSRKLLPYVIDSFLSGSAPTLTSGRRRVDWIYVDDVVDALLAAACADGIEGRTIDVGSGKAITVRTIVETLARLMESPVVPQFGAKSERLLEQVRVADLEAGREFLGWSPKMPLEEGLRRTVEWYRDRMCESAESVGQAG